MVQGLTPWFQGRGPMGLTPGQGTKIPHTLWHSQKEKKKIKGSTRKDEEEEEKKKENREERKETTEEVKRQSSRTPL